MKFRLITTVWGPRFTDLFLRVTVRSLLAEGNIGAFGERHEAVYSIYTMPETADQLRKSPVFQRLENSIPVEFVLFGFDEIDPAQPGSHWIGWRRGADVTEKNREIAFFIIADVLYATNTLRRWVGLFEQGYRAVWTSTTQAVLETALDEVEAKFPVESLAPISLANDEVIDLAIRHLHPLIIAMFRDTRRASRHPEVVFTEVPGEGLAQRVIGSHPICVDPSYFSLSDAMVPLERFEAIAFDEPTGLGLEPLLKTADLYACVSRIDGDRLSNMGSWLDFYCTPSDLIESMQTHRFSRLGCQNDPGFRRASAALGFYACQVRITAAVFRVVQEMRRADCRLAAQVAASAHYAGRLRRHWRIRGPVTVFVPTDGAINAWGIDWLNALLRVGSEQALARAALAHVFEGRLSFAAGDEVRLLGEMTAATNRALLVERRVRILAGPIERDDCTIYVIDRVLLADPAVPESSEVGVPGRWTAHPTRLRPSLLERQEDPGVVVPVAASMSRRVTSVLRSLARFVRLVLRLGYRVLRTLPGARRLAESMRRRLLGSMQGMKFRYGEHRAWIVRGDIAALSGGAVEVPGGATDAPGARAIEAFQDLQRARVILTVAEILAFYRSKVGDIAPELPSLELVESCIQGAGLDEEVLEAHLRELLEQEPNFAEAWYELGSLLHARKEHAEAIVCFDRCLTTKIAIPVAPDRTGCDVLAASAKASALEESGLLEMAAETYRRATALPHQSGMVRVAYARLLRRLGRPLDAAAEFDAGMVSDGTAVHLPSMSHPFWQLAERLVREFGRETSNGHAPSRDTTQQGEMRHD
jgi:tetratricopeptide (TPR) repeat protein